MCSWLVKMDKTLSAGYYTGCVGSEVASLGRSRQSRYSLEVMHLSILCPTPPLPGTAWGAHRGLTQAPSPHIRAIDISVFFSGDAKITLLPRGNSLRLLSLRVLRSCWATLEMAASFKYLVKAGPHSRVHHRGRDWESHLARLCRRTACGSQSSNCSPKEGRQVGGVCGCCKRWSDSWLLCFEGCAWVTSCTILVLCACHLLFREYSLSVGSCCSSQYKWTWTFTWICEFRIEAICVAVSIVISFFKSWTGQFFLSLSINALGTSNFFDCIRGMHYSPMQVSTRFSFQRAASMS